MQLATCKRNALQTTVWTIQLLSLIYHGVPYAINHISTTANDEEVDKAPRELLNLQLVSISANKTSPVWQYFAMVKDGLIMRNGT